MTRMMPSLTVLASLLAVGLHAAPAQAQLSRTFVSAASGNDANNCDRPTPCRTFQGAHDKTNPDGEITVLDPGGYGAVTITKSISIVNDGVGEAGILVSGGVTGITINGGPATYVNLRGITVQGIGFGGGTGMRFNSGFSLTITDCVFRNHTGDGIAFIPNAGGDHNLAIFDTLVADNGGLGIHVQANAAGQTVRAAISRVQAVNNSLAGMSFSAGADNDAVSAMVSDSMSADNGGAGIVTFVTSATGMTSVMVVRSIAANNKGTGVGATSASARLRIGQSTITGNARAWLIAGGTVISFGDNYIAGNGDDNPLPPLATIPTK